MATPSIMDIDQHPGEPNTSVVNRDIVGGRRDTSTLQMQPFSQITDSLDGDVNIHELGNVAQSLQGYIG